MNHKIIMSVALTCLAIAVPLCLMFLQRDADAAWENVFYHILLLLGVGVTYWSVSLMRYMDSNMKWHPLIDDGARVARRNHP